MNDTILVDKTIKIFENGVEEINKLKSSIIKLNDTVGELTNFNEILELEIDRKKVDDINKNLDIVISKNREILDSFESCISSLNIENKSRAEDIKSNIEFFQNDMELTIKKLQSINLDLNEEIIDKLLGELTKFIDEVDIKYKQIIEKYSLIEEISIKTNRILDSVNTIIEKARIDKKIDNTLNKIEELELKYNEINKSIDNFNKNLIKFNKDLEENNLVIRSSEILNSLNEFNQKINNEYDKIESKYNDINLLSDKINMEYNNKIKNLETKIDLLINENKALRLAYSTREIEDSEFKEDVLNIIKDSICTSNIYSFEDTSENIERLKEMSKKGDIISSFKLAQKYYNGDDINKNIDLAVRYYMIGAKNKHKPSILELMKIYTEEANGGNVKYQRILGMEYLKGNLVECNIDEAIKWLKIASENGSYEAKIKLDKINNINL